MQHEITRAFFIDTGHRVVGHEGKCAHLHGHRYQIQVTVRSAVLDDVGRVVDFSDLKRQIGGWLDANWDHGLVLWHEDPFMGLFGIAAKEKFDDPANGELMSLLSGMKVYVMPTNPTAENMARYLMDEIIPTIIGPRLAFTCTKVVVMETPNCWAVATLKVHPSLEEQLRERNLIPPL